MVSGRELHGAASPGRYYASMDHYTMMWKSQKSTRSNLMKSSRMRQLHCRVRARPETEFAFNLTASRSLIVQPLTSEIAESIHNQTLFDSLLHDLRHGVRLIRRDAMVPLVIIVTLTAAIGINASVFTVVNG